VVSNPVGSFIDCDVDVFLRHPFGMLAVSSIRPHKRRNASIRPFPAGAELMM
jgi:hypothetical protein